MRPAKCSWRPGRFIQVLISLPFKPVRLPLEVARAPFTACAQSAIQPKYKFLQARAGIAPTHTPLMQNAQQFHGQMENKESHWLLTSQNCNA